MSSPARDDARRDIGDHAVADRRASPSTTSSASTMRALVRTGFGGHFRQSFCSAAAAEAVPGMHGEGRAGLRLDEQRQRRRPATGSRQHGAEHLVERGAHARRFAGGDAAGQRHVEAERLEHVGIAPLAEVAELLGAHCVGIAALDLGFGQRRAETVERLHHLAGEAVELGNGAAGTSAKKPSIWPIARRGIDKRARRSAAKLGDGLRRAAPRSRSPPAGTAPSASRESRSGAPLRCGRRSRPATSAVTGGAARRRR